METPLFFQKGAKVTPIMDNGPPEKKFEHLLSTQNEGAEQTDITAMCSLSINLKPFDKVDDSAFKFHPEQFTISRSKKKDIRKGKPRPADAATFISSPKKKCKYDDKLTAPDPVQQQTPQKLEETIAEPEEIV